MWSTEVLLFILLFFILFLFMYSILFFSPCSFGYEAQTAAFLGLQGLRVTFVAYENPWIHLKVSTFSSI